MFNAGDTVMHPAEGVCHVEDVRTLQFGSAPQLYYVLHPTGEKASSTVYLPVFRGDSVLRRLLSREDILRLIHESADYDGLSAQGGLPANPRGGQSRQDHPHDPRTAQGAPASPERGQKALRRR